MERPASPLRNAAVRGSDVGAPGARIVAPWPPDAVSRARTPATSDWTEPARITPTVSSTTSLACSRTALGIASHGVAAMKCASCSIASPIALLQERRDSRGQLHLRDVQRHRHQAVVADRTDEIDDTALAEGVLDALERRIG